MKRREFLALTLSTSALGLVGGGIHFLPRNPAAQESRPLLVLYPDCFSPEVIMAARHYLQSVFSSERSFHLRPVSTRLLGSAFKDGLADAVITTPGLWNGPGHPDLLGSGTPNGARSETKLRQLLTYEGRELQAKTFCHPAQSTHLVACGADSSGFFSKRPLKTLQDIKERRYSAHRRTEEAWSKLGARGIPLAPEASLSFLLRDDLDFTGLLSHGNNQRLLRRALKRGAQLNGLHYVVTDKLAACPTLHLLLKNPSQQLPTLNLSLASRRATHDLQKYEESALDEIRSLVPVVSLGEDLESQLTQVLIKTPA